MGDRPKVGGATFGALFFIYGVLEYRSFVILLPAPFGEGAGVRLPHSSMILTLSFAFAVSFLYLN